MKILTILLLISALVFPAGLVAQAVAPDVPEICSIVMDDEGSACCGPAVTRCCCAASPASPAPPAQPLPQPTSPSSTAKDIAASLPRLLLLAELPRLADAPAASALFDGCIQDRTAPPVRPCVLRCSLLI